MGMGGRASAAISIVQGREGGFSGQVLGSQKLRTIAFVPTILGLSED